MAVAFVQASVGHNEGAGTTNETTSKTVTSGNILAGFVIWASSTNTLSSVARTSGTATLGAITTTAIFATGGYSAKSWWCNVTGSGTVSILTTFSAGNNSNTTYHELSGADTTTPITASIGQRQFVSATTADTITSTAATPSADNCYIFGGVGGNIASLAGGTGFTRRQTGGGATEDYATEDLTQGTAASIAATFTPGTMGVGVGVAMIAIQQAAAAGGTGWGAPFIAGKRNHLMRVC